ncbi:MAG: hypothetical protein JXA93_16945 [Anaerolineae bacterium]|nr:hypothetical protein [Anaerolineae bacterium]
MQGAQAAQIARLVAIPLGIAIGSADVRLPIVIGGALMLVLAGFLALTMTEHGFAPTPRGERSTWSMMRQTLADTRALVERQPVLLVLLGIGLFYGLYSEGFDRLWTAHMIESFAPPLGGTLGPVVWLGTLRGVLAMSAVVAVGLARRTIHPKQSASLARVLMGMAAAIVTCLALFGLTRSIWVAAAAWWAIGLLRNVTGPLQTAWYNRRIDDPQVRATLFSVSGQVDALGQIAGGPAIGAVGNASIRLALVVSAALLSPAIPLYMLAARRESNN